MSTNGFDIGNKSVASKEDEGIDVHIQDENDVPLYYDGDKPVTIRIAGSYSAKYRRVEAQIRKRKFKPRQLTGEKFFDENMEKVIACSLAWAGFIFNGVPVEMNRTNLHTVYTEFPWVLDQVTEAMNDHENFSQNS